MDACHEERNIPREVEDCGVALFEVLQVLRAILPAGWGTSSLPQHARWHCASSARRSCGARAAIGSRARWASWQRAGFCLMLLWPRKRLLVPKRQMWVDAAPLSTSIPRVVPQGWANYLLPPCDLTAGPPDFAEALALQEATSSSSATRRGMPRGCSRPTAIVCRRAWARAVVEASWSSLPGTPRVAARAGAPLVLRHGDEAPRGLKELPALPPGQ